MLWWWWDDDDDGDGDGDVNGDGPGGGNDDECDNDGVNGGIDDDDVGISVFMCCDGDAGACWVSPIEVTFLGGRGATRGGR